MTMRTPAIIFAIAVVLVGCDPAKEPMKKAREAEAAGKLSEAKTLYEGVCKASKNSRFCPVAKRRIDAISVREAIKLVSEGEYAKAKELGATITDANAKRAFDALAKTKTMTIGLSFDEANASADKMAARAKMEELAATSSPVAGRATEWLAKNGPELLLVEIKDACKANGTGSCRDLGQTMAKLYPSAPEAAEAKTLVDNEYNRIQPLLKQAEGLLVQRLEVYNWKAKQELCLKTAKPQPGGKETQACNKALDIPEDRGDPFNTDFLEKAWKKKLEEIHDPGWVKTLEERWKKVAESGAYDQTNYPKRSASAEKKQ